MFEAYVPAATQPFGQQVLGRGKVRFYVSKPDRKGQVNQKTLCIHPSDFDTMMRGKTHVQLFWDAESKTIGIRPCESADAHAMRPLKRGTNSHQQNISLKGFTARFGLIFQSRAASEILYSQEVDLWTVKMPDNG